MRGQRFRKDYAGTPLLASRLHWGTQVFFLVRRDFRG